MILDAIDLELTLTQDFTQSYQSDSWPLPPYSNHIHTQTQLPT